MEAKLEVLDAEGRSLPAHFVAGIEGLILSVDESTARYPVTVDPIAQQAYIKASNTGAGDRFGSSIAISGDTVVVGAQAEASGATGVNGNQSDNSDPNAGRLCFCAQRHHLDTTSLSQSLQYGRE